MDAGTHLALSVGLCDLIIFPLIELAGALLADHDGQVVESADEPND
jgi:hypothetical protein